MQDAALESALQSLTVRGVQVTHRIICPGDETALLPIEEAAFAGSVESVRRQSGAARIAARQLLTACGHCDVPLPRSASGAPSWPPGIVGSFAHDEAVAIAAIAASEDVVALGVDVEPAQELPPELVDLIATPTERARYGRDLLDSRLLFVIKEAVYKATHPLDGLFLDFHDIEVDLDGQVATTREGRRLWLAWATAPRVVALAFVRAAPGPVAVKRPAVPPKPHSPG